MSGVKAQKFYIPGYYLRPPGVSKAIKLDLFRIGVREP